MALQASYHAAAASLATAVILAVRSMQQQQQGVASQRTRLAFP
jgi:hypothetical protein